MDSYNDRLKEKTVIITGAARGFGEGIARELFRQGANIVIADVQEQEGKNLATELNKEIGKNRAQFLACDVADFDSVSAMMAASINEFGSIDVLISNAGILHAGSLDEMDAETFERVTGVNYIGYFNCVKAVSPYMKAQHKADPGRYMDIIQVNSKSGLQGSLKNFAYAGSKFGGIGLTQSFALELIPYNLSLIHI